MKEKQIDMQKVIDNEFEEVLENGIKGPNCKNNSSRKRRKYRELTIKIKQEEYQECLDI